MVVYVRDNVIENTEIIIVDKLRIINTCIKMSNGGRTEFSALYRSHNLPKTEFVYTVEPPITAT